MHRFHIPADKAGGSVVRLEGSEAHHALHVLRVSSGEPAQLLDGLGNIFDCVVGSLSKRSVDFTVRERNYHHPLPFQVTLLQAIPKGKAFDNIVQKATELGASRIVPLLTSRTVVQLDTTSAEGKVEKWRQIAIEAIKQCGSPWLPGIARPISLTDFLKAAEPFELSLAGDLRPGSQHPRRYFNEFRQDQHRRPRTLGLWIGPEGDFTPEELTAILATGAKSISLGPLVLRSDTAAIYALSTVNYELQAPE